MRSLFSLFTILCTVVAASAQLTFQGSSKTVITETPEATTGIKELYVVYDTEGVTASFTAKAANVKWYKYNSLGGGYSEEITPDVDGKTYSISLPKQDMGYIIEDGFVRHFYWVVNYANHRAAINDIIFAEDQECDRARIGIDGDLSSITYYAINGSPRQLSRDIIIDYQTLVFDAENQLYVPTTHTASFAGIDGTIGLPAPLCDTNFSIEADRFLKSWGETITAVSATYSAIAVEAHTSATQDMRDNANEQKVEGGTLGGSAPVDVTFTAEVTDAAIFREWQLSTDPEFETIDDRFPQLEFTYTFRQQGTTYVRFVANNAYGTCEYYGETYDILVGESALLCPNAFSPNGDGVNDEWKVSYKSIIQFECSIFNRWGQLMKSFTNPADGWDGKYKGKTVPTGVYYYVIRATGADGKKYKLDGDINVLNKKANTNTPSDQFTE